MTFKFNTVVFKKPDVLYQIKNFIHQILCKVQCRPHALDY